MPSSERRPPTELGFGDRPLALELYRRIQTLIEGWEGVEVRTTKSQVAFRRRRGFAYLWLPPAWTRPHPAELVLSIALDREEPSPRFKQIVHPARAVWMHHLELHLAEEVDAEVAGWLRAAYDGAG